MAKRKTAKSISEMTREERIEAAWENWNGIHRKSLELLPPPLDNRPLAIGDQVQVGNLNDCVVADLAENNRLVMVEYTGTETHHGKPTETRGMLNVWPWFEVFPLQLIEQTSFAEQRLRPVFTSIDVEGLLSIRFRRGVVVNPDYQRDYVWTLEDKQQLIESLMAERNIGSFMFVKYQYERYKGQLEILDGKQRLNALAEFVTGHFTYRGKFYHQLSILDRSIFNSRRVSYAELDGARMTRAELLEAFLETNSAGVPQSPEHLEKVRGLLAEERRNAS